MAGTGLDDCVCPPCLITDSEPARSGRLPAGIWPTRAAVLAASPTTCFGVIADLIGCLAPVRGSNYGCDHLGARGTDERS